MKAGQKKGLKWHSKVIIMLNGMESAPTIRTGLLFKIPFAMAADNRMKSLQDDRIFLLEFRVFLMKLHTASHVQLCASMEQDKKQWTGLSFQARQALRKSVDKVYFATIATIS